MLRRSKIGSNENSFSIIQADSGTSPTADSPADTLTLTSSDSSIAISANSTTDTINFTLNQATQDTLGLELAWNRLYPSSYKVFSYDGQNRIEDIDVYNNSGMSVHIFNKHIDYVPASNLVSSITVTSYIDSATLTKTMTYSGVLIDTVTVVSSYG